VATTRTLEPGLSTVSLTRLLRIAALEKSKAELPGGPLRRTATISNVRLHVARAEWSFRRRQTISRDFQNKDFVLASRTVRNCSKLPLTRSWGPVVGGAPENFRWRLQETLNDPTPEAISVPMPSGVSVGGSTSFDLDAGVSDGAICGSRTIAESLLAEVPPCAKLEIQLVAHLTREEGVLELLLLVTADAEVTLHDDHTPVNRQEVQRFRVSTRHGVRGYFEAEYWTSIEQRHLQRPCRCPEGGPCAGAGDDEPVIGPDIIDEPTATSVAPPSLPPLSFRPPPRPDDPRPAMVETTAVRIEPLPELTDDPDTEESPGEPPMVPPENPPQALDSVEGVGAKTRAKLEAAGILTLADLAEIDPEAIQIPGISARRLAGWRDAALALLDR
jgi:predicted flap endonuclease-1-like 5' DNA nuclease